MTPAEIQELSMLIRLLKAEGVSSFTGGKYQLTFHDSVFATESSVEGTGLPDSEVKPAVAIPKKLASLNANYFHPSLGLDFDGFPGND